MQEGDSHLVARPPFQSWGDQPAPVLLDVTAPRYIPPPNSPQTQDAKYLVQRSPPISPKQRSAVFQNNDKFEPSGTFLLSPWARRLEIHPEHGETVAVRKFLSAGEPRQAALKPGAVNRPPPATSTQTPVKIPHLNAPKNCTVKKQP